MRQYISTRDAASRYGVSDRTIRNWCADGTLKAKRFGKLWRVEVDEKERPAEVSADGAGQDEVLVSTTLKGHYRWQS